MKYSKSNFTNFCFTALFKMIGIALGLAATIFNYELTRPHTQSEANPLLGLVMISMLIAGTLSGLGDQIRKWLSRKLGDQRAFCGFHFVSGIPLGIFFTASLCLPSDFEGNLARIMSLAFYFALAVLLREPKPQQVET